MIGATLSHYRITAKLGEGGMGEVYRAEDTRLKREVAIKVLPEDVARDPKRLERFEREAHLLAALNHPNIAAIYGLDKDGGRTFLALELVEGEDLQERLERGAFAVDEALEIAVQIAEALEEAHNKGIVHRDLKPANVKLTPDGKVKVLDFGLAKAWAGDSRDGSSASSDLSHSPTMHYAGTVAGVILGTAAYMSPEQARGRPVDKKADIWAFGALLWEMLTGRKLFPGETVTDVIAAVITQEPDLEALPAETPPAVRQLIARCLRKDSRARLPDIGAGRLELQEVLGAAGADIEALGLIPSAASEDERRKRRRERWAWTALALIGFGLAAVLASVHLTETPEPKSAAHFTVDAPEGWALEESFLPVPSPSGDQVVFAARRYRSEQTRFERMLWVRSLESLTPRPLAGTEGVDGLTAFWSPDGRFVAFSAGEAVHKINLENGVVQELCPLPRPYLSGGAWSDDGTVIFSAGGERSLIYSVAASGGVPEPLMDPKGSAAEPNQHFPQLLPDGRRLLFEVGSYKDFSVVGTFVVSLEAPENRRRVASDWLYVHHSAGHLLFARNGTLFAQRFDMRRVEVIGEPLVIANPIASPGFSADVGIFSASPMGTLAYISPSAPVTATQLAWVDRAGRRIETLGQPGSYGQIALAPDGRSAAIEMRTGEGEWDLWVMDLARGVLSRLTATPGEERDPVWSSDGAAVAFSTRGDHGADLRRKGLRTSDSATVIANSEDEDIPESWSQDGKTMLVVRRTMEDRQSVWAVPVEEDGEAEPILATNSHVDEPQLSPDGRWLAYVSFESGRDEVYVEPYRRDGLRVQVSVAGGGQPKWRRDGRELFYVTLQNQLMAVDVRVSGDRMEVELPIELFEIQGIEGTGYDDYAVSHDGQRFLVKSPIEEAIKAKLHVVTNWNALLE